MLPRYWQPSVQAELPSIPEQVLANLVPDHYVPGIRSTAVPGGSIIQNAFFMYRSALIHTMNGDTANFSMAV